MPITGSRRQHLTQFLNVDVQIQLLTAIGIAAPVHADHFTPVVDHCRKLLQ